MADQVAQAQERERSRELARENSQRRKYYYERLNSYFQSVKDDLCNAVKNENIDKITEIIQGGERVFFMSSMLDCLDNVNIPEYILRNNKINLLIALHNKIVDDRSLLDINNDKIYYKPVGSPYSIAYVLIQYCVAALDPDIIESMLTTLVHLGADINYGKMIFSDPSPRPLNILIKRNIPIDIKMRLITLMIEEFGANVNLPDPLSDNASRKDINATPLYYAIQKYTNDDTAIEIIKYLIAKGADTTLKIGEKYFNVSTYAFNFLYKNQDKLLGVLRILRSSPTVNMYDDGDGISWLQLCAKYNMMDIVPTIMDELGFDPNYRDPTTGKTIIHHIVDMEVYSTNDLPVTMYKESQLEPYYNLIDRLLERGVVIDTQDNEGHTPLSRAMGHSIYFTTYLREHGADITKIHPSKRNFAKYMLRRWKGFSKSDIEKLNSIYEPEANNYSFCPVCFRYVERSEACMYMKHNCSIGDGLYYDDLYNRYKNDEGNIGWCTICGRICSGHRHYERHKLTTDPPTLVPLNKITDGNPFATDCRGQGGGGLPEKFKRFAHFKMLAESYQKYVNQTSEYKMMKLIIGTVHMYVYDDYKSGRISQILPKPPRPFQSPTLPTIAPQANVVPFPAMPHEGNMYEIVPNGDDPIGMQENVEVIRFTHYDDTVQDMQRHEDHELIARDTFAGFIENMINTAETDPETFGRCYLSTEGDNPCRAVLYPNDIRDLLPPDLYQQYKQKFNDFGRFGVQGGGGPNTTVNASTNTNTGPTNFLTEATDAACILGDKKSVGGRRQRKTRRGRRTYKATHRKTRRNLRRK